MYKVLNGAIIVLGLAGATLAVTATPSAAVGISINVGDVAYGYQDGYWDHGHHWHHWRNEREMRDYRGASGSQYHEWKHDRDADHGWHS
jgi:hypothetical protein